MSGLLPGLARDDVADIAPLLRRATGLDAASLVRLRRHDDRLTALVRLPFEVLAARTIQLDAERTADRDTDVDACFGAAQLLAWIDGDTNEVPAARDAQWRGAVPPSTGWRRVDTVPDTDVRPIVRAGATTLQLAAAREGVPGAQLRAEVADALLDSVVLTVDDGTRPVQITLRMLSAVTRLGFLPRGSYVAVDVAGRWTRVAAAYGSVFHERAELSLALR